MVSPNEFWLECHALATAFHHEADSPQRRVRAIVSQFERMPPIAQSEVLEEMLPLVEHLSEIYYQCLQVHRRTGSQAADESDDTAHACGAA